MNSTGKEDLRVIRTKEAIRASRVMLVFQSLFAQKYFPKCRITNDNSST